MLLLDFWHGRDARLTLTSGTEDDGKRLTLEWGVKHKNGGKKVKEKRHEIDMIYAQAC